MEEDEDRDAAWSVGIDPDEDERYVTKRELREVVWGIIAAIVGFLTAMIIFR